MHKRLSKRARKIDRERERNALEWHENKIKWIKKKYTYKKGRKTTNNLLYLIDRIEKGIWTGDHVPGTYCNKNIYDCDRR